MTVRLHGLHERVAGPEGFPGLPGILNDNRHDIQNSNVQRLTYDKVVRPTIVNHMFGGVNMMKDAHYASTLDGNWSAKGICVKGAWDCNRNLLIVENSDYNTWVARATFAEPGTYVIRALAHDGGLWASQDITVIVSHWINR